MSTRALVAQWVTGRLLCFTMNTCLYVYKGPGGSMSYGSFTMFYYEQCLYVYKGPGGSMSYWSLDYLTTHTSLSPVRRGFAPGFVNYKKDALDSQPQVIKLTSCLSMVGGSLLGTPASSTTKSGRYDIAEIMLSGVVSFGLRHSSSTVLMASKRNCTRRNKTVLGPRGQAETYLKIGSLLSNKTTDKLS